LAADLKLAEQAAGQVRNISAKFSKAADEQDVGELIKIKENAITLYNRYQGTLTTMTTTYNDLVKQTSGFKSQVTFYTSKRT
jgi:hypothetical protein